MKDIQSQFDPRRIDIKKVGVKNISYPITVLDKARKVQRTVAAVNMYVYLPHQFKGTHMSRFVEILNRFRGEVNLHGFQLILEEMKARLDAPAAHMEMEFPYFLHRPGSTGRATRIGRYRCRMHGSLQQESDLTLEITVPIAAPEPLQGERGMPRSLGHWGDAVLTLRFCHFIWLEDIIDMAEEVIGRQRTATAGLFQDKDREFTLSVENMAKALGESLSGHPHIKWFSVLVDNLSEGFSTFATIQWQRPGDCPGAPERNDPGAARCPDPGKNPN